MDDQTAQPIYSWFERPLVRIIIISTIYLLGASTVIVIQIQDRPSLASILPLVFLFLPTGIIKGIVLVFPYVLILFAGGRFDERLAWLGFLPFIGLIMVIMRTRSRFILLVGYIGFVFFILLAVKGCSQPVVELP